MATTPDGVRTGDSASRTLSDTSTTGVPFGGHQLERRGVGRGDVASHGHELDGEGPPRASPSRCQPSSSMRRASPRATARNSLTIAMLAAGDQGHGEPA